jgi:hypothetical protein
VGLIIPEIRTRWRLQGDIANPTRSFGSKPDRRGEMKVPAEGTHARTHIHTPAEENSHDKLHDL